MFEMACSCSILQKLPYKPLATLFDVWNPSAAMRGPLFQDHFSQISLFKLWKLRLKFAVGLTFVHSFCYSRALFTHLFWFDVKSWYVWSAYKSARHIIIMLNKAAFFLILKVVSLIEGLAYSDFFSHFVGSSWNSTVQICNNVWVQICNNVLVL